eukprot:4851087-Prymnesium_polylepis.2
MLWFSALKCWGFVVCVCYALYLQRCAVAHRHPSKPRVPERVRRSICNAKVLGSIPGAPDRRRSFALTHWSGE